MHSLERLYKNNDFKALVLEGYLERESHRVVLLKADPNMQDENNSKNLDKIITGIGEFYQYLNRVEILGKMSERAIMENSRVRQDILSGNFEEEEV
jgi:hypothetical protein